MVNVHSTVGTLVVLGYLVVTALYLLALAGRPVAWARQVSFGVAGLLLLQYLLGFWLLGDGFRNRNLHYALALLALASVGVEHGVAAGRETPRERAAFGAGAAAVTFGLVVAAYVVGMD